MPDVCGRSTTGRGRDALMAIRTRRPKLAGIPSRFRAKIDFWGPQTTRVPTRCWLFTGANSGGDDPYGVTWDGQRRVKAHRFTYQHMFGEIPTGLVIDHLCKTHRCIRPTHLEAVTSRENILRGDAPGPSAIRTNQCKRGHEFTAANTIQRSDGYRECRTCSNEKHREGKRRRRAARKEATNGN